MNLPTSRRIRRALAAGVLVLITAAAAYAFVRAGTFFTREDALLKADAVFVLAGSFVERPLEGAELYREGWAPAIVMTYGIQEAAIEHLRARGIDVPRTEDLVRDLLLASGVPRSVILQPPRLHDNTAQEAQTLRRLAAQHGWRRVIVVTSRYHLRRAGFAFRRELRGSSVEVVMRGSRYDTVRPQRWWSSRRDLRWMLSEIPKMLAYLLGLGA